MFEEVLYLRFFLRGILSLVELEGGVGFKSRCSFHSLGRSRTGGYSRGDFNWRDGEYSSCETSLLLLDLLKVLIKISIRVHSTDTRNGVSLAPKETSRIICTKTASIHLRLLHGGIQSRNRVDLHAQMVYGFLYGCYKRQATSIQKDARPVLSTKDCIDFSCCIDCCCIGINALNVLLVLAMIRAGENSLVGTRRNTISDILHMFWCGCDT